MDNYRYVISKTDEVNVKNTNVKDSKKDNSLWVGIVGNYAMGFNKKQLIKIRDEINKLLD